MNVLATWNDDRRGTSFFVTKPPPGESREFSDCFRRSDDILMLCCEKFLEIQCILRFVTFSFLKKVLTNRVLLTNRVKCDKSGNWRISGGLNFLV